MVTTSMWHLTPLRPDGCRSYTRSSLMYLLLRSAIIDSASSRRGASFVTQIRLIAVRKIKRRRFYFHGCMPERFGFDPALRLGQLTTPKPLPVSREAAHQAHPRRLRSGRPRPLATRRTSGPCTPPLPLGDCPARDGWLCARLRPATDGRSGQHRTLSFRRPLPTLPSRCSERPLRGRRFPGVVCAGAKVPGRYSGRAASLPVFRFGFESASCEGYQDVVRLGASMSPAQN